MLQNFDSLFELMVAFPDEQSCIDHLRAIRWRDGAFCPHCGSNRIYHFSDHKTFKCGDCRARFSIKVGTVFEDTKLPLRKWFMAVWIITNHPKGIASTTLAKDLKITQKSAWFVLHRLRYAARTNSFNAPLSGNIETDTTFVGGKERNKHANKRIPGSQGGANKAVVIGAIEREGELRTAHIEDTKAKTVHGFVKANVANGSALMTDEDSSFLGLDGEYNVYSVNHSKGEYVRHFIFHTNGIESVWALLKRQIFGIHHWVSDKHLNRYVSEMTWRFNRRDMNVTDRMNDIFACAEGRLTYKALVA